MTDQPTARQVIRAALAAAGGPLEASRRLGVSPATTSAWIARASVPAERIVPLCAAGGNVVSTTQILEALAREAQQKAAA